LSIDIERLGFSYNGGPVLDDVSLTLGEGLVHLVFGHTGCGKTTLALLLVGLLRPGRGKVLIDGADPAGRGFDRRRIQLAFQFPETQMFEVSVENEIAYGLKNFGLPAGEIRERSLWALDCVGLPAGFMGRDPHTLSFGERRKVALASVIAIKPAYLVMDEPLAGLDWTGRKSLVSVMERLKGEGLTTVILTHETDILGEVGDTVVTMEAGRVSGPRPAADFMYGAQGPGEVHLPEFMKMLRLMEAAGYRISGSPYRAEDVARALIEALERGQVDA